MSADEQIMEKMREVLRHCSNPADGALAMAPEKIMAHVTGLREQLSAEKEKREYAEGEVILKGAACASLRDRLREWKELLLEAADSVHASLAETDISDDRKQYRKALENRLRAAATARAKTP